MSDVEPKGPYIYQLFGMQDHAYGQTGRIFAIGGLSELTTLSGLTRVEAGLVLAALLRTIDGRLI